MNQRDLDKPLTKAILCPVCAQRGRKVLLFTVHSVTREDFIRTLCDDDYYFCASPDCAVVYYGAFLNAIVKKDWLKTRVGLKEKNAPRPVCYCFGYTIEDIHREIQETAGSTVEKEIADKIEAGLCHCEDANPEGRCCLGRVATAVKEGFCLYGGESEAQNVSIAAAQDCCEPQ